MARPKNLEISPKSVNANRRNAHKSTGPRTPEGKAVVSHNALKHGLLSKELLISSGCGQENSEDYRALLGSLIDQLRPEGAVEEILVERIAICYWRLRRVLRAEVGEVRSRLDRAGEDFSQELIDLYARDRAVAPYSTTVPHTYRTAFGQQQLMDLLDDARLEVEQDGQVTKDTLEQLARMFGPCENGIAYYCLAMSSEEDATEEADVEPGDQPQEEMSDKTRKKRLLDRIAEERKRLGQLHQKLKDLEAHTIEARHLSLSLPDKEATDKILRYETTIQRQLYRAMDQLERLQRRRGGETVPPPINVGIA